MADNTTSPEILEFLTPVADMVNGFTDFQEQITDDGLGLACSVVNIGVEMPVEIHTEVDDSGKVALVSAPPTQQIETSIFPVLHTMRLVLVADDAPDSK